MALHVSDVACKLLLAMLLAIYFPCFGYFTAPESPP